MMMMLRFCSPLLQALHMQQGAAQHKPLQLLLLSSFREQAATVDFARFIHKAA
jgi:hypothetical protein